MRPKRPKRQRMKRNMKVVDTAEYVSALRELTDAGHEVSVVIAGGSMLPFLAHGRDTIVFSAPDTEKQPLRRGDMVFYRRDDGRYVMHRIYRAEKDGTYTIIGDAQTYPERGIRAEQIFARVTSVQRKEKRLREGDFLWDFFARVWILPAVIPCRRGILYIWLLYKKLSRAAGRLRKTVSGDRGTQGGPYDQP